ncbi:MULTISPECIES: inorganic phosphate transporter [unclassified Sphingomonas]|jgi:inorganic phosphate transporter, PiT family|uniref:inorganic phosphate transporter n=2 Tax=Bacteria TaxID=2 RepID=UPI000E10AFEC|nr:MULTISPECIES: inorganic phosphate transporter [unclassified Sphingomonas]AXJ94457.1 inorganic phosphate transporter [Sphingomonas sp. FARSPH]
MATIASTPAEGRQPLRGPHLDARLHPAGRWIFLAVLIGALGYAGFSVLTDTAEVGEQMATGVFLFLGLALLIALGFEFVNGFHDTANAVATVIYTHALPAPVAVVWSGFFNFLGVLTSSGAVAYSIVTLLPVDLILHVGSLGGFAMIFALLLAAIIWNLATWAAGLPNSSSHALIGSILGVGLANQLLARGLSGTSGVDWHQAQKIFITLLVSPLVGFAGALLLMLVMKRFFRDPTLYREPPADRPPSRGIRGLLIFTCTAVSFAHGSNDGQKGMGLIMLILIGCAPTAYALNRTVPDSATPAYVAEARQAAATFAAHDGNARPASVDAARATITQALSVRRVDQPAVYGALAALSNDVGARIGDYGALSRVPAAAAPNLRADMYLVLDASKQIVADEGAKSRFSAAELDGIKRYGGRLEQGTRYIPLWVKVTVAIALGLGTMVGWKRIVVTVGEKIGKTHLTYGMGVSAELMAASTILLADRLGMPVSTTHVLSSGVAGASVGNGAGLQWRTVRNMATAWFLTLPAAMLLAGLLYWALLTGIRVFAG